MDRCRISLSMLENCDEKECNKYICPCCKWLLEDAVQTNCGHWLCRQCAQQLFTLPTPYCPKDNCAELLRDEDGGTPLFPDHVVRREVARLQVRCVNDDKECSWTEPVSELRGHLISSCEHRRLRCQDCEFCPLVDAGCKHTKKIERAELHKHLTGNKGLLQHLKIVANSLQKMSISRYEVPRRDQRKRIAKEYAYLSEMIASLSVMTEELNFKMAEKDAVITGLQAHLKELEQDQHPKSSAIEDLDFRLSLVETTNFDDTMIWKVPHFTQRMKDARSGKYTNLSSVCPSTPVALGTRCACVCIPLVRASARAVTCLFSSSCIDERRVR